MTTATGKAATPVVSIHSGGELYIPGALANQLTQGKPKQLTIHARSLDGKHMLIEFGAHADRLGIQYTSYVRSVRWKNGAAYSDFPNTLHRWLDIPLHPSKPVRFDWQVEMTGGRDYLRIDGVRPIAGAVEPEPVQPGAAIDLPMDVIEGEEMVRCDKDLDIYALQLTSDDLRKRVGVLETARSAHASRLDGLDERLDQEERARKALADKVDGLTYRDDIEGLQTKVNELLGRMEVAESADKEAEKAQEALQRDVELLRALDRRPWWRRQLSRLFGGE